MTIVWIGKDMWMETLVGSITTAASIGFHVATANIDVGGVFLGGSMVTRSGQNENLVSPTLQPAAGGVLSVGDFIPVSVRVGISQIDATARTVTFNVTLWFKNRGRNA